jgi:hypothetical protein
VLPGGLADALSARYTREVPLAPDPVIDAYRKDVDLTLLRENLKFSPEERIVRLMALQRAAEALRAAGEALRGSRDP